MTNLFAAIAGPLDAERFDVLLETPAFKLERIVSTGQATPRHSRPASSTSTRRGAEAIASRPSTRRSP